jgi:hypothetical protein
MFSSGVKTSHELLVTDKNGKTVYGEKTRKLEVFCKYDRWRSKVCYANRGKYRYEAFRRGDINILTLFYSLWVLFKEVRNGTGSKHNQ